MKRVIHVACAVLIASVSALCECTCHHARKGDQTRLGGNIFEVVEEHRPVRRLRGVVSLVGNPAEGALVEVFTNPEYLLKDGPKTQVEQRRIAACTTAADGKFCFDRLQPGKYELRSSLQSGVNVTHVYVVVARQGENRALEVLMYLGT